MDDGKAAIRPTDVLLPLGLATALSLIGDASLYAVLPTHAAAAGVSLGSVGIILGVNRAVRLLFNGAAGQAYDRWPRRWVLVPSLFVGALSTAVYAATRSFWPLLAGRLLWGLAWSGIWVGGAIVILDVATDHDRGHWTGLYQTWFFLGTALGALVGGVLTDVLGYHGAMWMGAALTAVGGLVVLFQLPETQGTRRRPESGDAEGPRSLRGRQGLQVAALVQGINRFVTAGVLSATLALLVQQRLTSVGTTLGVATLSGLLMAGRTLLSTVAAPLAGTISDRLGNRWRVTAAALAVGVAGMALVAQSTAGAILSGILLGAVAAGSVQALAITLTGDLARASEQGRAVGVLNTVGDLGSALGPPLAYALLPWIELRGVYLLCAGLFGAALGIVLWLQPSEQCPSTLISDRGGLDRLNT